MKLGSLFSIFFLLVGLSACSSKSDTTTAGGFDERAEYAQSVDKRINELEKKAAKLNNSNAKMDIQAGLRDVRAEYDGFRTAPANGWFSYRSRIDSGLDRVEGQLRRAE